MTVFDVERWGNSTERAGWQLLAACKEADSALFFPPDREGDRARRRRETKAKAVCLNCPVLPVCRSHALVVEEPFGIWGALTEEERVELGASSSVAPAAARR